LMDQHWHMHVLALEVLLAVRKTNMDTSSKNQDPIVFEVLTKKSCNSKHHIGLDYMPEELHFSDRFLASAIRLS